MVLGADRVVMSDMSELGPIDPQALIQGEWRSVYNYLDAYREHARTLAEIQATWRPGSCWTTSILRL